MGDAESAVRPHGLVYMSVKLPHAGLDVMPRAVYIWMNLNYDASTEIGDIAGVADVTIRQSYRLIYPRAAELFPTDFKFDTPVDKLPQLWSLRAPPHSHDISVLYLQDCILSLKSYLCWIWKTSCRCQGARTGIKRTHSSA